MKILKYLVYAGGGYLIAFIAIFIIFSLLDVTGWYIVYIPFLSIIGLVISITYIYMKDKHNSSHKS